MNARVAAFCAFLLATASAQMFPQMPGTGTGMGMSGMGMPLMQSMSPMMAMAGEEGGEIMVAEMISNMIPGPQGILAALTFMPDLPDQYRRMKMMQLRMQMASAMGGFMMPGFNSGGFLAPPTIGGSATAGMQGRRK